MKLRQKINDPRFHSETLIKEHINYINTNFLAEVVSISEGTSTIQVKPLCKKSYYDKDNNIALQEYDPININVGYIKGFESKISEGDKGLVIVCQHDIDSILNGTDYSIRKYDMLDGIFMPFAFTGQNTEEVKIITDNYISISNGVNELMSVLKQFALIASQIEVNLATGLLEPSVKADFEQIESQIGTFIKP